MNKNYSSFQNDNIGLNAPSICFNKIINLVFDIFEKYFEIIMYKKKFHARLTKIIKMDI